MTPNEERLVVELQSKWGNRWSRIARKLPGRTDNEIKNYWRTHMRKKAQETKKKGVSSSFSSSSFSSTSSSSNSNSSSSSAPDSPRLGEIAPAELAEELLAAATHGEKNKTGNLEVEEGNKVYSMDDLWKEFEFSEENCTLTNQTVASPIWDYCPNDSLWCMNEEESKMLMQQPAVGDHHYQSFPFYNYMI